MSEKATKSCDKNSKSNIFKWFKNFLIIVILELLAVGLAILINESRNHNQTTALSNIKNELQAQNHRIASLEELPDIINQSASNILENKGNIKFLNESLNNLKEEVGNRKIDILTEQLSNVSRRMESVEENKNREALALSIALLIKENALYGRSFQYEANILKEIASNQESLKNDIEVIEKLNGKPLLTNDVLIKNFLNLADNFDFEKNKTPEANDDNTSLNKGLKKIKDTVSNISFDKIVVVKKDNKTPEQKLLLKTLTDFVVNHQFVKAVDYINNNPIFFNSENKEFQTWFDNLNNKIIFDEAISKIISSELNLLREDIKNGTLDIPSSKN